MFFLGMIQGIACAMNLYQNNLDKSTDAVYISMFMCTGHYVTAARE